MDEGNNKKKSKIIGLIDDFLAKLEEWEPFPEWDGVLMDGQRCDGLFGWFLTTEEFMQIQNLNPCFPTSKENFGRPVEMYTELFGEKPPTPKKAVIGYHTVHLDHPDFPRVWYLCADCEEIWRTQM
tara:strand:+ start:114 stop:491 length:378 start_codon:yes stop_codon:yes gene_type:complete